MAPWHIGCFTSLCDYSWKDSISREALRFVNLAGIHIGLSRVPRSIYQELWLILAQRSGEDGKIGVVELCARNVAERNSPALQVRRVCAAYVAGTA